MQFQKFQTKQLAHDYVCWRLAKGGYNQSAIMNRFDFDKNNRTNLFLCMRAMAYEFELIFNLKNGNGFSDAAATLSGVDQFYLTSMNCRDTFLAIARELFLNEYFNKQSSSTTIYANTNDTYHYYNCNWGKLVALFSFTGCMAIRCCEKGMPVLVYHLIDWLNEFITSEKQIPKWMFANGNWNGFVAFFNEQNAILKLNLDDYCFKLSDANSSLHSSPNSKQQSTHSSLPLAAKHDTNKNNSDDHNDNENDDSKAIEAKESNLLNESKRSRLKRNAKSVFCQISRCVSLAVSSVGILAVGALYIKKN